MEPAGFAAGGPLGCARHLIQCDGFLLALLDWHTLVCLLRTRLIHRTVIFPHTDTRLANCPVWSLLPALQDMLPPLKTAASNMSTQLGDLRKQLAADATSRAQLQREVERVVKELAAEKNLVGGVGG